MREGGRLKKRDRDRERKRERERKVSESDVQKFYTYNAYELSVIIKKSFEMMITR